MVDKEKTRKLLTKKFRQILDDPGATEASVLGFLKYWDYVGPSYTNSDYGYLLNVIELKLSAMEECFNQHPIAECDWRTARDIRICKSLIPIASGNDYTTPVPYVNYRNLERILGKEGSNNIMKLPNLRLYRDREAREEKAWHLLLKIFQERMKYWWN